MFTIPPLNFTIKYRKSCVKSRNPFRLKSLNKSNSNYTVAYIIIGALLGFALLIASSGVVMFFNNKIKHRKLHAKYESLQVKLGKQKEAIKHADLVNSNKQQSSDDDYQKQVDQLKSKMYTKNAQVNKNKNFYISKKSRQIDTAGNSESTEAANEETQNIYESVQEASVINMTTNVNDATNEEQSMISRKISRNLLNITTNTIQSCYTTANTVSTTNLLNSKPSNQNFNKNSVEMCTKFKREQIEFENVYLEGTFSRIYEGKLFINENDEDFQSDTNQKESAYDNFDTSNMHKSRSSHRLSKCFNIDKEKGYMKVLIKTVNDYASLEQTDLMLKESCLLRGLKHKNLNPILGVCIEPDKHTIAVFPYNEMGNLKLYLNTLRQAKLAKHADNVNNIVKLNVKSII